MQHYGHQRCERLSQDWLGMSFVRSELDYSFEPTIALCEGTAA